MNLANVEFKPLKWYKCHGDLITIKFGSKERFKVVNVYYMIFKDENGYDVHRSNTFNKPAQYIGEHIKSLDAAKSIAQKDYEKLLTTIIFKRKK